MFEIFMNEEYRGLQEELDKINRMSTHTSTEPSYSINTRSYFPISQNKYTPTTLEEYKEHLGIVGIYVNQAKGTTVIKWKDKHTGEITITKVKVNQEEFDLEKGIAMCFMKHYFGDGGMYMKLFKEAVISNKKKVPSVSSIDGQFTFFGAYEEDPSKNARLGESEIEQIRDHYKKFL